MHALFPGHNIYAVDLPLLIVLVSLVYSATRFDEWGPILREAFRWGLRLAAFLVAIGIVLYVVHYFDSTALVLLAIGILVVLFVALSVQYRPS